MSIIMLYAYAYTLFILFTNSLIFQFNSILNNSLKIIRMNSIDSYPCLLNPSELYMSRLPVNIHVIPINPSS